MDTNESHDLVYVLLSADACQYERTRLVDVEAGEKFVLALIALDELVLERNLAQKIVYCQIYKCVKKRG